MLEVVSSFVPENTGKERQHDSLLRRELEAERSNGVDNDDLELVGDVGHEGCDLLHQAVHGCLVSGLGLAQIKTVGCATHLQQGGDGICGDRSVRVGDQVLHIHVAGRDSGRLGHGELVQRLDSRELENGLWRREEELQNCM